MKFALFKKIFKKSEKIYFSTKGNKYYLTNGHVALQFDKDLRSEILENIGFAGCELEKFAIVKEYGKTQIIKDIGIDIYSYFEDVDTIPAKYTDIILDGIKKEKVFDVGEGLLMFDFDYIDMAFQLTDTLINVHYSKELRALYFYSDKVNVFILSLRTNKKKNIYLSKKFLV